MTRWVEESSADSATTPVEIAPKGLATPESKQEAQDAFDVANKDTQKNLNDLKTTIDSVKAAKDGKKRFTEALNSNAGYKKQVEQILGTPSWERRESSLIIADIKKLQSALNLPDKAVDGALGPKTFKELKGKWDARPQGQDYKTFIDGLIRPNAEKPATVTKPPESSITLDIQTPQAEAISPKMEENTKELRQDMESGMLRVGDEKINFELKWGIKTAFIDRDAYKIMNNADNSDSYELNIRAMEDNVVIKKEDIQGALESSKNTPDDKEITVNGLTKPKKLWEEWKPVTLIMNREPIKQENKPATVSSEPATTPTSINITMWNVTLDNQNQLQTTMDVRSPLEQSLADTPLPEELQVDKSVAPNLQAQIAIQPVVEALKS